MKRCLHKAEFRILKVLSAALGAFLGVCCSSPTPLYGAPEYGMPYVDYKISGTVRAKQLGQPISGISVSLVDSLDSTPVGDTVLTDSTGKYAITLTEGIWRYAWILRARDVDGADNGSFMPKDTVVAIPESDLAGAGGTWYEGHGEKTVDMELEEERP